MLKYLHIENIAVIEHNEIEFSDGFNVLTGETGAGKSIIIDSINAVLGERTSKDLIRTGCDSAEVSAVFGNISKENIRNLNNYDISPDDDGNIIITRKLSLNGKGYIKINGKPSTASTLKEISAFLINIHGQHDNQALLNPETHCSFLDAVAENSDLINDYYQEFRELNRIRKELNSVQIDSEEKEKKTELLKYQINELETADIKIGEIEELRNKLKIAETYEETVKTLNNVSGMLNGSDDTDGALSLLNQCIKRLSKLEGDSFSKSLSLLQEALLNVTDVSAEVGMFLSDTEFPVFQHTKQKHFAILQKTFDLPKVNH